MALRVISHYPTINAVDVPRNIYVKLQLNSGIIPESLTYTTVSVNDASTYTSVAGDLAIEYNSSGIANIIQFQPTINLTANTTYQVFAFGRPNSIISTATEQLATTYSWSFTTGNTLLEDQVPDGIPSGDLPVSGSYVTTSGTYSYITEVIVEATNPQNQQSNITDFNYAYIQFNAPLVMESGMCNYIEITSQSVLI